MFGIAVQWLRHLVVLTSRRRSVFYPRLVPCGGQTGKGTGFSPVLPLSCFSIDTPTVRIHSSDCSGRLRR